MHIQYRQMAMHCGPATAPPARASLWFCFLFRSIVSQPTPGFFPHRQALQVYFSLVTAPSRSHQHYHHQKKMMMNDRHHLIHWHHSNPESSVSSCGSYWLPSLHHSGSGWQRFYCCLVHTGIYPAVTYQNGKCCTPT
jgi:hypothetical protein